MMSSPAPLGMFIIGFIIFALYLWGLLTMIYRGHRQQREEFENDPEIRAYYKKLQDEDDYVDYDGHGNWGRFPDNPYEKKPKRKKGSQSRMKNYFWHEKNK